MFTSYFLLLPPGHRLLVQRPQSRSIVEIGTRCEKIGSLFGVWCCDVNSAAVFLHASCSLAGMHLVLHRANRCRQWGELSSRNFFILDGGKLI